MYTEDMRRFKRDKKNRRNDNAQENSSYRRQLKSSFGEGNFDRRDFGGGSIGSRANYGSTEESGDWRDNWGQHRTGPVDRREYADEDRYRNDAFGRDGNYGAAERASFYNGGNALVSRPSAEEYVGGQGKYATRDYDLSRNATAGERYLRDHGDTFRGKGPKGYKRSDERIEDDVCGALTDSHNVDASNIDVKVKDRVVILSGTVSSLMQKRNAERAIDYVSGIENYENRIHVKKQDHQDEVMAQINGPVN